MTIFTHAEKTVKKHTVDQALDQALMVLKHNHNLSRVCTDMVKGRDRAEPITVETMSKIVEDVVLDTLYWEGKFI